MPAPANESSFKPLRYAAELTRAMDYLALDPRTVFLGQAVAYPGTAMSGTLANVPLERRIELPVAEELQMGMTTGLALAGFVPVSLYPRWNFLLLATNQLVNHLDKLPLISGYRPKVIIRVGVGSERPLHPQQQHVGDFTDAFRLLCRTVEIVRLHQPDDVMLAYRHALEREDGRSTILVEYSDYFNER